jgi:hypothetical protein
MFRMFSFIISLISFVLGFIICAQLCDDVTNKCRRGLKCVKKNETVSVCRKRCPIRWACYEEKKSEFEKHTLKKYIY